MDFNKTKLQSNRVHRIVFDKGIDMVYKHAYITLLWRTK